jgi:hypothetical protein
MLKSFDRLSQRLSDPLLTVMTLMLSFLLFVLGPMQAAGILTGQHFGYFFGLVLIPAAFLGQIYPATLLALRMDCCPAPSRNMLCSFPPSLATHVLKES